MKTSKRAGGMTPTRRAPRVVSPCITLLRVSRAAHSHWRHAGRCTGSAALHVAERCQSGHGSSARGMDGDGPNPKHTRCHAPNTCCVAISRAAREPRPPGACTAPKLPAMQCCRTASQQAPTAEAPSVSALPLSLCSTALAAATSAPVRVTWPLLSVGPSPGAGVSLARSSASIDRASSENVDTTASQRGEGDSSDERVRRRSRGAGKRASCRALGIRAGRRPAFATQTRAFFYKRRVLRLQVLQLPKLDGCQDACRVGVLRTGQRRRGATTASESLG